VGAGAPKTSIAVASFNKEFSGAVAFESLGAPAPAKRLYLLSLLKKDRNSRR